MAKLINKKLEASTLIEVLIAMVIIMVVFAIAMQVFGNVLRTGVSYKKLQAQNQMQLLSEQVKKNGYVEEAEVKIDSISYQLSIAPAEVAGIAKLEIKASLNGANLGNIKCLFKEQVKHED
ncbi:type II secretion system protein [Pedobacter sp. KR3-3]|uniref:Type II secretion system protein n=1 Tax=Pedobacter albus TaxID=3113905 RepID=A0ABU7I8Z5_9SPHI|nr:type II secretion system protein [Pedobacter sp. KR3-3]MEE1945908.1 type II secretion system protein [Pedobacter sp. KR3-3]